MPPPEPVVAAVDIGGTRIKASLVDRALGVRAETTTPTPAGLGTGLGPAVAAVVADLVTRVPVGRALEVVGCGVVVPGIVDEARGIGVRSVNLGWSDLDIRSVLAAQLGMPVAVGHDVRAGLLAEARLGAAVGERDAAFVPLGTGIAAALLLDGRVVHGAGYAGELGHVVIDPDGPVCPCGQRGCLELLASASAVELRYAAAAGTRHTAREVAALAAAGDPQASTVWREAVRALGAALTIVVTLTGVRTIVVGGGLAQSGEQLLAPLRTDLAARFTFQRMPRVVGAALGDRAGALGAACLAWAALDA